VKHDVHYVIRSPEEQTSLALVCCFRCRQKASAYDKNFMRVLIEADDCPGERTSPTIEELKKWMSGAPLIEAM
jgi:hypothetical protein